MTPWMVADLNAVTALSSVAVVAWLGVATTTMAYWLFFLGLEGMSAATASALMLAEPVVAVVLGVVALGERASLAALGSLLLLGGLVAAVLPISRPVGPIATMT